MKRSLVSAIFVIVTALLFPIFVLAQTVKSPAIVRVSIMTSKGEIILALDAKRAPITTANFLHYVDNHKLDGAKFYRAVKSGDNGFTQASAAGFQYPPIAHESTKMTGLSHTNGAISMARYAPGTAASEFVFCVGDNTYMDAGRDKKGDNLGYATFGHVIKGMSVVRSIMHGRIAKPTGGALDGQMLHKPIMIIRAKRL